MKLEVNKIIYIALACASAVLLWIYYQTDVVFMLHLSAIPLEALVVVFIIQKILQNRENEDRRRQLMYIKSCMFRAQMRDLFMSNISNLKYPSLTMSTIRHSKLHELRKMRKEADKVEYKSLESMEHIITEYVNAEHVWYIFLQLAVSFNFNEIIRDMINVQHFIQDVKIFKRTNPDQLFIYDAQKKEHLMKKVQAILGDGIRKFLDYLIELKEKQPEMFHVIVSDYEASDEMYQ